MDKYGPGDDAAMIADPEEWPVWPFLPMKNPELRDKQKPHAGFFFNSSTEDSKVVFYEGFIFDKASAVKTDLTPEQVLAAGWIID